MFRREARPVRLDYVRAVRPLVPELLLGAALCAAMVILGVVGGMVVDVDVPRSSVIETVATAAVAATLGFATGYHRRLPPGEAPEVGGAAAVGPTGGGPRRMAFLTALAVGWVLLDVSVFWTGDDAPDSIIGFPLGWGLALAWSAWRAVRWERDRGRRLHVAFLADGPQLVVLALA